MLGLLQTIINAIKRFVDGFVELLKAFGLWLLDKILKVLESFLNFVVDLFCDIIEAFFHLIDFKNSLFDASLSWSSLPDSMIYILNACGFDNCLLILASAILIRLTLNLIPSWATRV